LTGVLGHRLFEFRNKPRSVWLVRASFDGRPASRVAQGRSGSWGALSFGYLFFVQAKKSNSPKRRKATLQTTTNAWASMPPPYDSIVQQKQKTKESLFPNISLNVENAHQQKTHALRGFFI